MIYVNGQEKVDPDISLSVCSPVALSVHVADLPPSPGGNQSAGATSCWPGGLR